MVYCIQNFAVVPVFWAVIFLFAKENAMKQFSSWRVNLFFSLSLFETLFERFFVFVGFSFNLLLWSRGVSY